MRLFKYCLYFSCFFCGCADATPKEKISEFVCPFVLPAEKDFPVNWVMLGKVPIDKLQLEETDFISGNAVEVKERLSGVKERIYSRDSVEEWTDFDDRSEAVAEYPEDHAETAMMCTYGKTRREAFDVNRNVVLLIQLPQKKPVNCLLVRRDIDPRYEMSCKIK